jgi:hypothetical protein
MNEEASVLPPPLSHRTALSYHDEQLMQCFVGEEKYQHYYQKAFSQLTATKHVAGINWGAFVFGVIWLFYRKMYGYGTLVVALLVTLSILENMFKFEAKGVGIAVSVSLGLVGNSLYKKFAEQKIAKVHRQLSASDLNQALEQAGGTNLGLAWVLLAFIFVAVFIAHFA